MFQIDFVQHIMNELPAEKRTQFNQKLHEWWLSYCKANHEKWYAFGQAHMKAAQTTSQIGSLVKFLNELMNSEDIYITDAEWVDDLWLYLQDEPYDDIYLYLDSETIDPADEVYLYTDEEVNALHFTVWIPAVMNTPENLELINAYVAQHSLAGKNWNIEIIP